MNEHEDLFTRKQTQLMSIAGWANNLAWVALVIYLFFAALTIFVDQSNYLRLQGSDFAQGTSEYWRIARLNLFYYLADIGSDILSRILTGFIYYVVLKGIGIGLYMVIETDMNYREKEGREATHEYKIS